MSKILTVELPDEVYDRLQQVGLPPADWIAVNLQKQIGPTRPIDDANGDNGSEDEGIAEILARAEDDTIFYGHPRPQLTEAWRAEARKRFEHHIGAVDLGYPTGADNESIDADLAREYANRHDEED